MTCTFCGDWKNVATKDCKVCGGTGWAYRFDQALEYFPNIKQIGLQVSDYNCSWWVSADSLEKKLEELDQIQKKLEKQWEELEKMKGMRHE